MRAPRLAGVLPVLAALSKSAFGLLSNLFSLQSAQSRAAGPLLPVPAGQ